MSTSQSGRLLDQRLPFFLLLVLLIFCGWNIGRTIFDSIHTYGDAGTEAALLNGVRNFYRYGFIKTHFLPIHNSSPTAPFDLIVGWTYARYPPGPDLIASLFAPFAPEGEYWPFRILPTLLSLGAIYLLFRLCRDVIGNAWLALFVAFAYAMNYSFMKMADSFGYGGYAEFLRMLSIWAVYRQACASETVQESRRWMAVSAVASFINLWIGFDYVPTIFLTAFLLVLFFVKEDRGLLWRIRRASLAVLPIFLASCFAMLTRVMQNGWAEGSVWQAVYNFYLSFIYRIFNTGPNVALPPTDLSKVLQIVIHRTQFSFGLNWIHIGIGIAALGLALLLARRHELVKRYGLFFVAMMVGNVSYQMMLPGWAEQHYGIFGIRHILPTYALITGGGVFFALWPIIGAPGRARVAQIGMSIRSRRPVVDSAPPVAAGLLSLAAAGAIIVFFGATLLWNFNDTRQLWRTSDQNSWAERFAALDDMRNRMPPNAIAFGNAHWFRPEARYRLDRLASGIVTMADLRDNTYWLPADDPRTTFAGKPPLLEADKFAGYFVFYERWGLPDDGFFPNFTASEGAALARDRYILEWLQKNAEFVSRSGKWSLFRLKRLPTTAEAEFVPAVGQTGITN